MCDMKKVVKPAIEDTPLDGVKIIWPKTFPDDRGFFSEAYNEKEWAEVIGFKERFYQDAHSWSKYGTIRGMHCQPYMGKLVTCIKGEIYDVAVNCDPSSKDFGKHFGVHLNDKEKKYLWVPPGFVHGLQCLSESGCHVYYKCTAVYDGPNEFGMCPLDPAVGIKWPLPDKIILSPKDREAPMLRAIPDLAEKLKKIAPELKQYLKL